MHLPHKADFDAFFAPQFTSTPHWIGIFLLQVDFATQQCIMGTIYVQIIRYLVTHHTSLDELDILFQKEKQALFRYLLSHTVTRFLLLR